MAKLSQQDATKRIEQALESGSQEIYFNGFANSLGLGDVLISLERNGKPVAILNTSYTVAKTLAIKLNDLIRTLENNTDTSIMTTDKIASSVLHKGKENDAKEK